jgi:muramoyltetrapeptide carboxypeptidase
MQRPQNLITGDKIGIVAPARKISPNELLKATNLFTQWGMEIILGLNIFNEENQYAGTDKERTSDLQYMLDDKSIKAIIFARGGYGTIRILDQLDWTAFAKNPKWLIGFSDITAIHSYVLKNLKIQTLHAIMPINFNTASDEAIESIHHVLFGKQISYTIKNHSLNKKGEANAQIVGGNLSLLHTLGGSNADIDTTNKILFIEDLDEYLYHIDRMMLNLKRSGKLDKLAGLIVGGMTEMNDNKIPFGRNAYEIISEHIVGYHFPVCFNFPAGHISDNRGIILGRVVYFKVDSDAQLIFEK